MKILTVTRDLSLGGTARAAQIFTSAYRKTGHEVAVLSLGLSGPRGAFLRQTGVEVYEWEEKRSEEAFQRADVFRADVVHIHRRGWEDRFESRTLERLRRAGSVVLETNVFGGVDYSAAADCIDVHFQLSQWCMWRWRQRLGARRDKVAGVIVPYPVDASAFQRASDEEIKRFRKSISVAPDAFVVGRVGQPLAGKWHPQNIMAFIPVARLDPKAVLLRWACRRNSRE